jgi:hypothetical protein
MVAPKEVLRLTINKEIAAIAMDARDVAKDEV